MTDKKEVQVKLSDYGKIVDDEIEKIFQAVPDYEMYDHLAYFMGLKNQKLEPERINAGKRFRSGMAMLLAEFYGNQEEVLPSAVSIELFHNFTLVHDDIVDGDTLRRGRPTVWKLFGTDHAINDGDAQLLLSLETILESRLLSAEQKISIQSFLIKQYRRVVEGQYLDFSMADSSLGDKNLSESLYLEMIGRKTSDLIVASTVVAGLTAGVAKEELKALHEYGHQLGLIYQICDDNISIWGTSAQTGKRDCGDILERKKTLPILWWYENASEADRSKMRTLYNGKGEMSEAELGEVLKMLDSSDTYQIMMDRASEEANKAKKAAEKLSFTNEQKQILLDIVDVLHVDIKAV